MDDQVEGKEDGAPFLSRIPLVPDMVLLPNSKHSKTTGKKASALILKTCNRKVEVRKHNEI